ncbi:MAG TPA: type II toxin-antitoxin system VapC family toxin [Candidatus Obscuribacterales bacterium]
MSAGFLLDTNVVSEPLKPKPSDALMARLKKHENELCIASIVWHELLFGCCLLPKSKKRSVIEDYLSAIDWVIMPYDAAAADWHARERARLTQLGKAPSFVDGQIAAIAATQNLVLVTFNVRHFAPFQGLTVVDWRE